MKYIITKQGLLWIFPKGINHCDAYGNPENIESAGFVLFGSAGEIVVVHGSQTLGIERNEEQGKKDEKVIREEMMGGM